MSAIGGGGVPLTPQGAPLTPEEQQLIARLFSDPFYFPLQFKTWLEWFVENAQGNVAGGTSAGSSGGNATQIPVGGIMIFAAATLPDGFLWCNGGAYARTGVYNTLYKAIGTTFGVGDGSTTFNVPDLDGRAIVGWAQSGGHADVSALGASEGVAKNRRRPKHRHTPHMHPLANAGLVNYKDGTSGDRSWSATAGGVDGGAAMNAVDGGSGNINDSLDAPAFLTLAAMIRYI